MKFLKLNENISKKMHNTNGVTLIALVITIIVLLILASITLNLALDENGIIRKAIGVSREYKQVEKNELDILNTLQNNLYGMLSENQGEDIPMYTVVYHVDVDKQQEEQVQIGSTCLNPSTFTPSKDGYKFVGWRKDTEAKNEVENELVMQEEGIELYAVFSKVISVTYDTNGGEQFDKRQEGDMYYNNGTVSKPEFTLIAEKPTRNEYTFFGWSTNNSSRDPEYKDEAKFLSDADVTLYAVWKKNVVILYDNGNEYEDLTGGWVESAYYINEGTKYEYNKSDNFLYAYVEYINGNNYQDSTRIGFVTKNVIDVKYYNKIYVDIDFESNYNNVFYMGYFYDVDDKRGNIVEKGAIIDQSSLGRHTWEMDVSSYEEFLRIFAEIDSSYTTGTNGSISVYKVWMEI